MGLFENFRRGLKKTRDFVSDGFNRIAASMGVFDEDMLEELEMLLVQADVGTKAAAELLENIRLSIRKTGDASREAVLSNLKQGLLQIVGEPASLEIEKNRLNILLLVGVNGTGKTTTAGKICSRYKTEGFKIILGAADTFRAAAIDQLKIWGDKTDTTVISHDEGSDPAAVVFDAIKAAQARKADLLILDTAGRLHNKQNLMAELGKIRRIIEREAPESKIETLLVIDATTGQNAVVQAQVFTDVAKVSGLIITKMDGNAKGGVAVAVAQETRTPIYLAGLGEDVNDLVDFDPAAFVDSLLPEH
jgi:fused signal recognition particle receptor